MSGESLRHLRRARAALTASGSLEALAISYNGGKDCNVLVHLLAAVLRRLSSPCSSSSLPRLPALYVACAAPFAEVERFVAASVARYHLELRRVRSDMKGGLQEYMRMRAEHMGRPCSTVFVGQRRTDPGGGELVPLALRRRGGRGGGLALDGLTLAFPLASLAQAKGSHRSLLADAGAHPPHPRLVVRRRVGLSALSRLWRRGAADERCAARRDGDGTGTGRAVLRAVRSRVSWGARREREREGARGLRVGPRTQLHFARLDIQHAAQPRAAPR